MVNFTCPMDPAPPKDPIPFFASGNLNFKAHDVGWIITGFFTLIASVTSFWLIFKHLTYYTCPLQQKHIIRMLFMVPIYAIVSCLSYLFYTEALYYQIIRDCYEAVVITSFFYLFVQYIGDTRAEQQAVFQQIKLKNWLFPLGCIKKTPKSGLTFIWIMKICILQYAIVRPLCTIIAVGMNYFGVYCLPSWMPWFGHIYITVAISISVSVAMYCILQYYVPLQKELKPYGPVLKFMSVKLVVFMTFWQDSFLSLLVSFKVIKPTDYWTATEIQVGINALLETFEMCLFAFMHIKAFTYLVYRPQDRTRTTTRWRALLNVLDFRDWFFEMKDTTNYLAAKAKGRTYSYVEDVRAQKYKQLQEALGKSRDDVLKREIEMEKETTPTFWKHGKTPKGAAKKGEEDEYTDSTGSTAPVGDLDLEKFAASKGTRRGTDAEGEAALAKLRRAIGGDGGKLDGDEEAAEEDEGLLDYATRVQKQDHKSKKETHPELTLFHRPPTFDGELGPADPTFDEDWQLHNMWIEGFDKHGKHYSRVSEQEEGEGAGVARKKEGSWWRSLHERISGSWGGNGKLEEEDEMSGGGATRQLDEKQAMIREDQDGEAEASADARETQTTQAEAPRAFVPDPSRFREHQSPLTMLMGASIRGDDRPRGAEGMAPHFVPLPFLQQDASIAGVYPPLNNASRSHVVMSSAAAYATVNHGSVAHVDAYQPQQQQQPEHVTLSYQQQQPRQEHSSPSMVVSSNAPSAVGGPVERAASGRQPLQQGHSALRWADQKSPREEKREQQALPASASKHGPPASVMSSGSVREKGPAVGPKGMKINLVMPGTLGSAAPPSTVAPSAREPSQSRSSASNMPPTMRVEMPPMRGPADARNPPASAASPVYSPRHTPSPMDSVERWRQNAAAPSISSGSAAGDTTIRPRSTSQPAGPDQRQQQQQVQEARPRRESAGSRPPMQPRNSVEIPQQQRSRRTSAPPAPKASVQLVPDQEKRKGKDKYAATSNIPAPSQMTQLVNSEDPFAAGAHALEAGDTPEESSAEKQGVTIAPKKAANGPKHPHLSSVQPDGGSLFAVGSIVSPVALAQAAPTPMQMQRQMQIHVQRQMGPPPRQMVPPGMGMMGQAPHPSQMRGGYPQQRQQPPSHQLGIDPHSRLPVRDAYAHPSVRATRQSSISPTSPRQPPAMPHPQAHRSASRQTSQTYDRWTGEPVRGPPGPQQQRQGPPRTSSGFGRIEYID